MTDQFAVPADDGLPSSTRHRARLIVAACVVVVATVAGVTVFLVTRSSGGSDPYTGYGKSAHTVAAKLRACTSIVDFGPTTSRCVLPLGEYSVVQTFASKDIEDMAVAMALDKGSSCMVATHGAAFIAPDSGTLTEMVGIPQAFAADHGGYVTGCS